MSGVTIVLASLLANYLARFYSHRAVSTVAGTVIGCLSILSAILLPFYHHSAWLVGAVYLLAEVRGTLGAIAINWMTHDELPRDSRYSFAAIGTSVPLAGILLGILMGWESQWETQHWLWIAGVLDILAVVPLWWKASAAPATPSGVEPPPQSRLSIRQLVGLRTVEGSPLAAGVSQMAMAMIGFTFFKFLVLAIITFEWKRYTELYYGGDEHQLTAYFSTFYAVMHAVSLTLQSLVAGRLVRRQLLERTLLIMPLALIGLGLLLLALPSSLAAIVILTGAKGLDAWKRSVEDTGVIMLVSRVPKRVRTSLIALNTGIVKPAAEIQAAIVIWLLSFLAGDWVIEIWLVGSILWSAWVYSAVRQTHRM